MSDHTYEQLVSEYSKLHESITELDARKKEVRAEIAEKMHANGINVINVALTEDEKWKCEYRETNRKSVNYTLLMEIVGHHKYHEIVTSETSESLYITKAKKNADESALTRKAPTKLSKGKTPPPPTGALA